MTEETKERLDIMLGGLLWGLLIAGVLWLMFFTE